MVEWFMWGNLYEINLTIVDIFKGQFCWLICKMQISYFYVHMDSEFSLIENISSLN